jgi:hypothetical protein
MSWAIRAQASAASASICIESPIRSREAIKKARTFAFARALAEI